MKKFLALLSFFILINTTGCEPMHFLITGVVLNPVELYKTNRYRCTSELSNKITFAVSYEKERAVASRYLKPNIGSECYATSKGRVNDNHLLENTFSLTLDKTFTFEGNTVEAGQNVLTRLAANVEIRYSDDTYGYSNSCGNDMHYLIDFSDTFSENAVFGEDNYTVTFSCETSDKQHLQAKAIVKFL